jgi:hypothetical protein
MLEAYGHSIFKSRVEVRRVVDNMLRRSFYLSTEVYARFLFLLDRIR